MAGRVKNLSSWKPGESGNPAGKPKGATHLATRIQRLLEGDEKLPAAIAKTIRGAIGEDKAPVDAIVIVAMLQALQGDKSWADWLSNHGYGAPKTTNENKTELAAVVSVDPDTLAVG